MPKFSDMIRLIDALNLMRDVDGDGNPVPFSVQYVTHNRQSKIGGELIDIPKAVVCVTVRKGKIVYDTRPKTAVKRNPNHHQNSTRNFNIVGTDQIRKCNIRLITKFNGQKVVW